MVVGKPGHKQWDISDFSEAGKLYLHGIDPPCVLHVPLQYVTEATVRVGT